MKPKRRSLFLATTIFLTCSVTVSSAGNDLEIVAGGGNVNINGANPFETTDDSAELGVDLITGELAGGDVSVTTGTGGADTEAGNLTLSTTIDYDGTGSNTLTLNAINDITLSGDILDSVAGGDLLNLHLNAGITGVVTLNNTVDLSGGDLIATGQGFVLGNVLSGGSLDISGITTDSTLSVINLNITNLVGAGNDTLLGTAADETFTLTGANAGSFGGMTFTGVGAIVAAGGSDTLVTNAAASLTNTLNQLVSNGVTVNNVENLVSTHGTLIGAVGIDEQFNLTGDAAGTVIAGPAFSGITTINGNTGNDTLNFSGNQTNAFTFDGGFGDDTVNVTANVNVGDLSFTAETINMGGNTVAGSGNVYLNATNDLTVDGDLSASAILSLSSGGALTNAPGVSISGFQTILNGSSIALGNQAGDSFTTTQLTFNSTGNVTLELDSSATILGGNTGADVQLGSTGTIDFQAGATLTANSLTVLPGNVLLTGDNLSNSMNVTVGNSGVLTVNGNDTVATYTQDGTGTLAGSAALTTTGGATLNGGTVSGNLQGDTTSTGNVLVSGTLGGGTLSVTGGVLTISGISSNIPVNISGGATLIAQGGAALSDVADVVNSGTFTVVHNETVGTYEQNGVGILDGAGTLTTTSATLNGGTVSGNLQGNTTSTGNVLVSGTLGGGTLSVNGGTLTITGATNSAGGTFVNDGTLLLNGAGINTAISSGVLTIGDGIGAGSSAVVELQDFSQIDDSSSVVINSDGKLTSFGENIGDLTINGGLVDTGTNSGLASFGTLTMTAGTIQGTAVFMTVGNSVVVNAAAGPSTISSQLNLAGNTTFSVANGAAAQDLLVSGAVSGGGIIFTGAGTMALTNGGNTYAGGTSINGGTLHIGATGATGLGTITVLGSTIDYADGVNEVNPIDLHADVDLNVNGGAAATQTGAIGETGGSFGITKTGGGDLTIAGANTYTGATNVSAGTVILSGSLMSTTLGISSGAALTDANGGLDVATNVTNAGTLTVNAADTVATYIQNGTGTLAGSDALTTTGGATLNGGTVSGNLQGDTTSTGNVLVSGTIGGGSLSVTGNTLTLTGTSTNTSISISAGAALVDNGTLNAGAVSNAGTLTINAPATVASLTNNSGLVNGSSVLTVTGTTTFNGGTLGSPLTINGLGGANLFDGALIAGTFNGGGTLNNSTISGAFNGTAVSTGSTLVSGTIGGGSLAVNSGTFTLTGTSNNTPVTIAAGATLLNQSGGLSNSADVTNAGTLTVNANDTVNSYIQNGSGLLNGSATLTATSGATLNGGEVAGSLAGNIQSTGNVLISGTIGGGTLSVTGGTLTLTGTANSNTTVNGGATLRGTGILGGGASLLNNGTLAVGSMGGQLTITGGLTTNGTVSLSLNNQANFESIFVGGNAAFNGNLVVTNTGTGLSLGEQALIINAGSYSGSFSSFNAINFANGVLFDNGTGRLIGLGGGDSKATKTYLNLTESQTDVYLSLFEDSVQLGVQNVTIVSDPTVPSYTINFVGGISDGDPMLVNALNIATFTNPGTIFAPVINQLSPEVHRGMVDYTEQALRAHVRAGIDAAPISRTGDTQVFATAHSTMAGADASNTNANYDTEMIGVTLGVRHDIDQRFQVGGLFGADDGSIEGALIDTDAQGWVLGVFGRYLLDEASQTKLTASLSYGSYDFDAARRSFGGTVTANGIESDAFELAVGVSTVSFEQDGFRVIPSAGIRYLTGSVDSFVEGGAGVPLSVRKQDIDSLLLEVGVDFEYQVQEQLSLFGHIGYVTDFEDSDNSVSASYAASGAAGRPFTVRAPGIDDEAFVLGLGAYYDINDATRVGLTYRGEFRSNSESAHSIGLGASFGF
jgi:hypothetical protein